MCEFWYKNINDLEDELFNNKIVIDHSSLIINDYSFNSLRELNQLIYSDTQEYLIQSRIAEGAIKLEEQRAG